MNIVSACFSSCLTFSLVFVHSGCSAETTRAERSDSKLPATGNTALSKGSAIEITPGSPAETVRAFYTKLRERRIREAIFLTNLRPAIEGLTDDELKEFAVDFEAIARSVPSEVEINGEIISGDTATVTAKLPDENNEKLELQQIRLRREGELWIILSADDETEKRIKKEGKNYFALLRVETKETEARAMLDRIAKAQMVHSLQNKGGYADMGTLIDAGLLPSDVTTSESTGYDYVLTVADDRKTYTASATPASYGKTGKNSFLLAIGPEGKPRLKASDNGGKPLSQ